MKTFCNICLYLFFFCFHAGAQSYYTVTHTSGKKIVGGVEVEVVGIDSPKVYNLSPNCGAVPYHIGDFGAVKTFTLTNGYSFRFAKPPRAVRFNVTYSDYGERLIMKLNDTAYKLSATELSWFLGSCGNSGYSKLNGGEVIFDSATSSNNTRITISGKEIHTVTLSDVITQGGSVFSFQFAFDTTVNIVNYTDTLLCVGDTMHIPYEITGTFLPGNIFTFQLSDKNGSFANPIVLGNIADTGNGVFKCKISASLLSGGQYHVRVVSSLPAYTSIPNEIPIGIGHPPQFTTFTSAPACENDTITIGTVNFSHVSGYSWRGPSVVQGFPAQHVRIPNAKMKDGGMYYVAVHDYGCVVNDSIFVELNENPLHSIGSSNSPVCTGDTLKLTGKIDTAGVVNTWVTAQGKAITINDLLIPNVQLGDSGAYILTTVLNGCTARDTSFVIVHQRPDPKPTAGILCAGDSLVLSAMYLPGAKYQWSGPSGFLSQSVNYIIHNAQPYNSGYYVVKMTANGCIGTDSSAVLVKPMPDVPIAKSNSPVCEGSLLHLYADNVTRNASYIWSMLDTSTINGADIIIPAVSAGLIKYRVSADLNGCEAADTVAVQINHTPKPPIVEANTPLKLGADLRLKIDTPEAGVGYTWSGPNGFTSLVFNPVIKKAEMGNAGTYSVIASFNGCSSSASVYVDVVASVDTGVLVLYPNPNDGEFIIKATLNTDQQVPIRIVNATGATIFLARTQTQNKILDYHINLKDSAAGGVYFLMCYLDNKKYYLPFVIDRSR